jgi:hypothetical protein
MSLNNCNLLTLALGCVLILGCSRQGSGEISATAAAVAVPDGSVQSRQATAREKAELDEAIRKEKTIDERFPGSPTPWGSASERVTGVFVPGVLKLAGGASVRLDGIRCDEKAVGYLRRILQEKAVSVVVLPAKGVTTQPVPAEVWSVDTDLQRQGLATTPSYSNVVETAITSGWCQVEASPTSKHNERYAALAQAFQSAR